MTIKIPALLDEVLTATADEVSAKARISIVRATLEDEGRRRLADEGAAPTWNAKGAGTVRYQEAGDWSAIVAAPQEFASYVAEHHPDNVTATVILNAADLAAVLEAIEFTGVRPLRSELEVREPFGSALLKGLTVSVEETERDTDGVLERVFTITDVDETTGESRVVPGVSAAKSPAKLVVSLDKTRKADAVAAATKAAEEAIARATVLDDESTPTPDAEPVRQLTDRIAAAHADVGQRLAQALGLSTSGTKVDLARRVALAAFAQDSHMAAVLAVLKAAELAPKPVVTMPAGNPEPATKVDPVERLDPADPELGVKALQRAEQLKAQLDERRRHAEAHPEDYQRAATEDAVREASLEADVVAASTPAPAPSSATETAHPVPVTPVEAATPATVPTAAAEGPGDTTPSGSGQVVEDPFAEVIQETATEPEDPTPAQVATIAKAETSFDVGTIAEAFDKAANREKLRSLAKAKGVAPGGTKGDVIGRLVAAGYTVDDLT